MVRMSSINTRYNTPDLWPSDPPGFLPADSWCFGVNTSPPSFLYGFFFMIFLIFEAPQQKPLTGHFYLPPLIITYRSTVRPYAGRNALNCFTCTIFPGACLCLNIFSMFSGLISTQHYTYCTLWLCPVLCVKRPGVTQLVSTFLMTAV